MKKQSNPGIEWLAEFVLGPAALVPADESTIACNSALERILSNETEAARRRLRQNLHDLAAAMHDRAADEDAAPAFDERLLRLRSASRRYRLEPLVAPGRQLLVGIIRVHRSRSAESTDALAGRFGFTRREAEVAALVAGGLSNKSIAAELRLSPHTVRRHTESVLRKLGVTSRAAVAARLHR